MGRIHRTLVVTCLLLVLTSPAAGAVTSVSTSQADAANASAADGDLLTGVVGTVDTVGDAATGTLENGTDALDGNGTTEEAPDAGDLQDAPDSGPAGVTDDASDDDTTGADASDDDTPRGDTSDDDDTTGADASNDDAPHDADRGQSDRLLVAVSRDVGNGTVTVLEGATGTLETTATAASPNESGDRLENATLGLVRAPGNATGEWEPVETGDSDRTETGEYGREVLVVGGREPLDRLGVAPAVESMETTDLAGEEAPLGAGTDGLVRPELPRLALTESALVLEVRTVDAGGLSTVAVPLDAVDSHRSLPDGDGIEPGAHTAPPVGADETERTATPTATPTPADGNASTAPAAPDEPTGESSILDSLLGLDPGVALEFAPPLGTTLFVVAARPWFGAFSGVSSLLSGWLGRAFVLLRYGRHDGSDPLEHETRSRIHDLVSETPGQTLTQLSAELDTPLSTIRHHVRVLERERVIVSRKQRGNRRIYPLGAENAELAAALQEESSAAVIAALHEQGRATVGDVVDRVEKSYSTVSYHLSRLVDEGLVVQERDGREKISRLDPDVASLLDSTEAPAQADADRPVTEASAD